MKRLYKVKLTAWKTMIVPANNPMEAEVLWRKFAASRDIGPEDECWTVEKSECLEEETGGV